MADYYKASCELHTLHRYINNHFGKDLCIGEMNYSIGAIEEHLRYSLDKEELETAISAVSFYLDIFEAKVSPLLAQNIKDVLYKLSRQRSLFVKEDK